MRAFVHLLVCLTVPFVCVGLWGMLNLLAHISAPSVQALPAFTRLLVDLRGWILLLPVMVVSFGLYALCRRTVREQFGVAYVALSTSALCFVAMPVFIALFQPCVLLMEQSWGK